VASDFTRLKILYALEEGEKSVTEIVEMIGASQSLVSHQLATLKKADLVRVRKEGTHAFYSLSDDHVEQLLTMVYEHVTEKEGDR
ncbi:MAG: helix-turn-helix transcriptional regulator, partial [Bacilli bacterium]|nr:helix-turn-helix transcriptional regulator [Bacilli bacterium]